jgi:predicted RNA binding protein YcfA (HicA-like mRNA interferase family)
MTRLPRVTGEQVKAALLRSGFVLTHVRGSHHYLRPKDGGVLVTIPVHSGEILALKTLKVILDQAGITVQQLRKML